MTTELKSKGMLYLPIEPVVPKWSQSLFSLDWLHTFVRGGRWGSKTTTIGIIILTYWAYMLEGNIVCARQFKSATDDSFHALFVALIAKLNLENEYEVQKTKIVNKRTGCTILFTGIEKMEASIRSIVNVQLLWIDEAQALKDYDQLNSTITSIRSLDSDTPRRIIMSYNPMDAETPVERLRAARLDADLDILVNWRDVSEFLPDEFYIDYLRQQKAYADSPAMLRHIFEGAFKPYTAISPFGIINIENAFTRDMLALPYGRYGSIMREVVAGVDVARKAAEHNDYTAVVKMDCAANELASIHFKEEDHQRRLAHVADFLAGRLPNSGPPADYICVDTTNGEGLIMAQGLRNQYAMQAYDQTFGGSHKERMVAYATRRFSENTLTLRNPELRVELLHFELDDKGRANAEYGFHDDYVDALMLALECLYRWGLHGSPTSEVSGHSSISVV